MGVTFSQRTDTTETRYCVLTRCEDNELPSDFIINPTNEGTEAGKRLVDFPEAVDDQLTADFIPDDIYSWSAFLSKWFPIKSRNLGLEQAWSVRLLLLLPTIRIIFSSRPKRGNMTVCFRNHRGSRTISASVTSCSLKTKQRCLMKISHSADKADDLRAFNLRVVLIQLKNMYLC